MINFFEIIDFNYIDTILKKGLKINTSYFNFIENKGYLDIITLEDIKTISLLTGTNFLFLDSNTKCKIKYNDTTKELLSRILFIVNNFSVSKYLKLNLKKYCRYKIQLNGQKRAYAVKRITERYIIAVMNSNSKNPKNIIIDLETREYGTDGDNCYKTEKDIAINLIKLENNMVEISDRRSLREGIKLVELE